MSRETDKAERVLDAVEKLDPPEPAGHLLIGSGLLSPSDGSDQITLEQVNGSAVDLATNSEFETLRKEVSGLRDLVSKMADRIGTLEEQIKAEKTLDAVERVDDERMPPLQVVEIGDRNVADTEAIRKATEAWNKRPRRIQILSEPIKITPARTTAGTGDPP